MEICEKIQLNGILLTLTHTCIRWAVVERENNVEELKSTVYSKPLYVVSDVFITAPTSYLCYIKNWYLHALKLFII